MLTNVSDIVQIIGFSLALVAIFLAYREGRNSRDLQAALTFADSFSERWSAKWRNAIFQTEALQRKGLEPSEELTETLWDMMNWLDTVGWMIDSQMLARPGRVLGSIKPTIRRILKVVTPIMVAQEVANGPAHWHGLRVLERALKLPELGSPDRLPQPGDATPDSLP